MFYGFSYLRFIGDGASVNPNFLGVFQGGAMPLHVLYNAIFVGV